MNTIIKIVLKSTALLISLTGLSGNVCAQSTAPVNASEILQGLEKLNTLGSVLYIAAHPDDENTRLLAYLSKERNVRTGYLSLTRGDGGQNLIGKEQGDALGLIRTQELLAARKVDGAEQFFTRANDFGYSKNPEETFSIWNKDSILADVVWTIRKFRPDVIICRFPTTGEGGHGHHTASAILALEAFDAAADPKRFPDQLKTLQTWQARRLFWNTFNFGTTNTTAPDQLQIDVGGFNTILGKSYGELAAESRSNHKSQGFGTAKTRGSAIEYFKLLKGDSVKKDLFDGIDMSWNRLDALPGMYNYKPKVEHTQQNIEKLILGCVFRFEPNAPQNLIPRLVEICKELQPSELNFRETPELLTRDQEIDRWKEIKLRETESLLLACSGLWIEASAGDYIGIPGSQIKLSAQIIKRNPGDVALEKITYPGSRDTLTNLILKTNELQTFRHCSVLAPDMPFSNPYWLNEKHDAGAFIIRDSRLTGTPENEPGLKVSFYLKFGKDLSLKIDRPVIYKYTDPVKGEVYRPLEILPPATVNISEKVFVFDGADAKTVSVLIKSNQDSVQGTLQFHTAQGWDIELKNKTFSLPKKGDEITLYASLKPGKNALNGSLTANYSKSIQRIEYDHIPYQFILSDAQALLVQVDLKKAGTRIAYIPGAGDEVAACLKNIGYSVTILSDELLATEDLGKYSAIVTGVRAFNTNKNLPSFHDKLMEYVKKGGNLIVQYNTNSNIGPLNAKMGPWPFTVTKDRVTDENAEVRMLVPQHPAFNFPNRIGPKDFEGWIQERGIYFVGEHDKNYQCLLSMNDPKEKPLDGSLLVGNYGKGNFVYTGLDFFRELPAGVPGAYRLMVNLISLPAAK